MEIRLQRVLKHFGLTGAALLAETGIAGLWTARDRSGNLRVVKIYRKGHFGNEAGGIALIRAWAGTGACVQVLDTCEDAMLMPWLDGPLLGARSRAGADLDACARLGQLAATLHRAPLPALPSLPRLATWFDALFALRMAPGCAEALKRDMGRASALARTLLDDSPPARALHGDLHHDNVLEAPQGPVAIDAKGVLGDPAYELANALRNPKGCAAELRDPGHMRARRDILAEHSGTCPSRLARWGAAKCALSVAWRSGGLLQRDAEADLLALLLAQAEVQ